MDTSEKRDPLLKELRFQRAPGRAWVNMGAGDVRDFYEAKIASGELRVVVKVKHDVSIEWDVIKRHTTHITCPSTKLTVTVRSMLSIPCCPCCGAQITD